MKMRKKDWIQDMARQRIERLFELAGQEFDGHPDRSNRYVQLARQIGMRHNVRIPKELKRRMCRHCHSYLVPGSNAQVRLRGMYVVVTCLICERQMRYPY
ncbi:MAG: ribonuclease P protein component 4 [Methanocellales archaeon]|nr:ribonuclease P protein component 4 [Methanocellales archaeon]